MVRYRIAVIGGFLSVAVLCIGFLLLGSGRGHSVLKPQPVACDIASGTAHEDTSRPVGREDDAVDIDRAILDLDIPAIVSQSQTVRPLEPWAPPEFDGKAIFYSPEDLELATELISQYSKNFAKIDALGLVEVNTVGVVVENAETKAWLARKEAGLHSSSVRIDARRDPTYFKIDGTVGGKRVTNVVTPAGEIGDSRIVGRALSMIPVYLSGERWFQTVTLLKYGTKARKDSPVSDVLPLLEKYVPTGDYLDEGAEYDVLEQDRADIKLRSTYFFNRETGMVDLFVTVPMEGNTQDGPLHGFCIYKYEQVNGVHYPRRWTLYDDNCQVWLDGQVSSLSVNGVESP